MKFISLLLTAGLVLSAASARAEEAAPPQPRGFLTGVGLGLLVGGLAGVGVGVAGAASAADLGGTLKHYPRILEDEAQTVKALDDARLASMAQAMVGFIGGALALAGGIACLALDGKGSDTSTVALVFTQQGGVLVLSGRF